MNPEALLSVRMAWMNRRSTTLGSCIALVAAIVTAVGCRKEDSSIVAKGASSTQTDARAGADAEPPVTVPVPTTLPGSARPLGDSGWKRIAELPDTCRVFVADDASAAVSALDFSPCGTDASCRSFKAGWSRGEPNTFIGRAPAIVFAAGAYHLVSTRNEYDPPSELAREIQVVERIDGDRELAVAVDSKASRDCALGVMAGSPGIAVVVQPSKSLSWAWIGTSSWERPNQLHWQRIAPASLTALGAHDDGYLPTGSLVAEGLWLGDDQTFSFNRLGTNTLAVPRASDGKRPRLGTAVPAGKGAFALQVDESSHGFGYVDQAARFSVVREPPPPGAVGRLAVDQLRDDSIVWLEGSREYGAHETTVFMAPFASRAADLRPKVVATLAMDYFSTGGITAHGGMVAFTVGQIANEPKFAYVIRTVDGRGWKLPSPPGRRWSDVAGVTDSEVWLWTSDATKVGANSAVRLRLDALGPPTALR
jgi:hypothetical protein